MVTEKIIGQSGKIFKVKMAKYRITSLAMSCGVAISFVLYYFINIYMKYYILSKLDKYL